MGSRRKSEDIAVADADGKPRLGCLVKPRSNPCRDFADPGWHGLAGCLCSHSREHSAQPSLAAGNTPVRSGTHGLESRGRQEFLGNLGSVDPSASPNPLSRR